MTEAPTFDPALWASLQDKMRPDVTLRGCCRSASIGQLAQALSNVQGEIKNPVKDKRVATNTYGFMYADLAACLDVARALMKANGIAVVQIVTTEGAKAICVTELIHKSGEWIRNEMQFATGARIQDLGGLFTYMRRYSFAAMIGIAQEDEEDETGQRLDQSNPKAPAAARAKETQPKQPKPPAKEEQKPDGQTQPNPPTAKAEQEPADLKRQAIGKKLSELIRQVDGTWDNAKARLVELNTASPFGVVCATNEQGEPDLKSCSLTQLKDIKNHYDSLLVELEASAEVKL